MGGTQTKNKTNKKQAKNKQENNRQSIASYGSDDTTGAPLTVEVTATTGRLETLEENQKVTLQVSLHFGDDVNSAGEHYENGSRFGTARWRIYTDSEGRQRHEG